MSTISNAIRDSNEVHFLVDLKFDGFRKRYSDLQVNIPRNSSASPAYSFDGKITAISSITNRFDINNFKYSLQTVSITIANPFSNTDERLQDFETVRKLDGSIGNIYIWSPGLTWEDIESDGLLFSGIFQKQYHNSEIYSFNLVDYSESRFNKIPNKFINDETFSNFNMTASSGSGGKEQQLIFGDWPKGIKLECIDTESYKYFLSSNYVGMQEGSFYPGVTEYLYASSGTTYTFSTSGTSIYSSLDGLGNPHTYVKFASDQSASEPLSCSMIGITDSGVTTIEHPSDITKYILDNYSNLKYNEIDYGSLDEMKNILSGVKYTTCFNSSISGAAAIDRLLNKLLTVRINKIGGKIGILCFNLDGSIKARYTKQKHCISKDIVISKTPFNLICNNLTVNYAVNVATGSYEKSSHADSGNNTVCKQSEIDYGKQPEIILTIPDIWDSSSIDLLIDRYLSFYAYRHDIVEWEVSYADGFDITEGDIVTVTLPEGSSTHGQGWIDEKCILLQRKFKRKSINQLLWCIDHAPGTKDEPVGATGIGVTLGGEQMLIGGEEVIW